jgi:hypothetical protein
MRTLPFLATLSMLAAHLAASAPAAAQADLSDARAAYAQGDFATAALLLKIMADGGDPTAQFELGLMHANGIGVGQDLRIAARWFRRAADGGHAEAQFQYGALVYRGQAVVQDHREAAVWFRRAAQQGHADAQVNLGFMHERGDGLPQDDVQAHKWFNLAAARYGDDQMRQRQFAMQARERVARRLSPAQRDLAHRMAADFNRQAALPDRTPLR